MTVLNYTPHPIHICGDDGIVLRTIEPSGLVRLKAATVVAGQIDSIPVTTTEFGEPQGLPEYQAGTYYIVSQLVKSALSFRTDLLVPAEVVRDQQGVIVGCKSLGI